MLLEPDEDALSSANRRQSSLFMDRDLPLRASSLNVMKAPTCCVRALSSARCCPLHALALPSVYSAPMMSPALVMPARGLSLVALVYVGSKMARLVGGLLSRGLLPGLKRIGGHVVSLRSPLL